VVNGEFRFRPTISYTPSDKLLFYIEGDFRADSQGFAEGYIDSVVEDQRRWIVDEREVYTEYRIDWFRARIGKQLFDWSVTDTISPSDNINARDWTDVIEFERVGVPAIDLRAGRNTYAELVYIPWFTPSKLPPIGDRWDRELAPGLLRGAQDTPGMNNGQLSIRGGISIGGFDIGAVYYRGYSYSPAYRIAPLALELLQLIPTYRLEDVYSGSIAFSLGEFNFRGELGYFDQRDDENFFQYAAGIDREWSGILRLDDSLYWLIQYADDVVTKHRDPSSISFFDFRRVLDNCITTKVSYSLDATKEWTIKIEGAVNLGESDVYIEPALIWRKRSVEFELGFDIMAGNRDTFWGGYRDNDRIYSKLTYKF
jgi:hypothetical protein